MDGMMDGWMDGWMDGRTDGSIHACRREWMPSFAVSPRTLPAPYNPRPPHAIHRIQSCPCCAAPRLHRSRTGHGQAHACQCPQCAPATPGLFASVFIPKPPWFAPHPFLHRNHHDAPAPTKPSMREGPHSPPDTAEAEGRGGVASIRQARARSRRAQPGSWPHSRRLPVAAGLYGGDTVSTQAILCRDCAVRSSVRPSVRPSIHPV
jgi:hypothetical protein